MNITLELTASPALLEAIRLLAGFTNPAASFKPMAEAIGVPETAGSGKEPAVRGTESPGASRRDPEPATMGGKPAEALENVTVELVRAATRAKAKAGKRAEVKNLLSKYGTDSVTNLDATAYAAFYAELEAL